MSSKNVAVNIETDEATGLFKATATLKMPAITVSKYCRDRDDFRYKIQSAFNEIIDEMVEDAIQGI
tara:strand:- start:1228 stop:1425 length:198 start_codon:yes stop_codon:yes gene_type:complete